MRQLLGTILTLLAFYSGAQVTVKGTVTASTAKTPVEGAVISLLYEGREIAGKVTAGDGRFEIRNIRQKGPFELRVQHVAYKPKNITVETASAGQPLNIELEESSYFLDPLEIKAVRAGERTPFTKQDISAAELEKNNLGADIPFLLNQVPSVVVNSDAGNGVGYTGIRIRGSDASRINVTLNGIPYNDPESQGSFFVDLPDFASSLSSVQIQRGVGTSSNGAGAFGATINLSTNDFRDKAYAELNNSFGSFNTKKHTLKAGTGLINNHFTVDARLSKVSSDGYIDRAFSNLKSFYLSGAWIGDKSTLRLNIFGGTEKTYQAWYGIDSATLRNNRTFNPAGMEKPGAPYDNQTDNYQQDHYQLLFNRKFSNRWSFNTAFFLVNGQGYYEQYRAQNKFSSYGLPDVVTGGTTIKRTDLVRQLWLDNSFYGQIASLHYRKPGTEFTVGGGWNTYDGAHFGRVIWAETGIPKDFEWYRLPALKKDYNIYGKLQQRISSALEIFADLQYRAVDYNARGFRDNPKLVIDRSFGFFNPKAGLTYTSNGWMAFASYAMGQKEPNRDDFEAGASSQPKPEKLHDLELGIEKKWTGSAVSVNVFYMYYRDQLVLTGKINDVGAYTRVNVPRSFRAGVELQAAKQLGSILRLGGNLAISENRINQFTEFIDDYDNGGQIEVQHHDKPIAFSPSVIAGFTAELTPVKNLTLGFNSKYVSRQYLDNTGNESRSLDPYFVQDAALTFVIPNKLFTRVNLILQANNIFNAMYEPNGYTFSYYYQNRYTTENYYFPMAGRNFMAGLNISL
ncbi:MAG TPA: TonB-dependent receptor plug domain-containing protein, partial [Chitinophagaceae bacterium]